MKKLDIDVPTFAQKNDRYYLQVLASNLTDGNIKLYVQEGNIRNGRFKRYFLREFLNNKIIEKYEKIIIVKGIINFYKKRGDFINIKKYNIVLNKLKKDIIELKRYSTYVITISKSEMKKVSDEMLKYELTQTIRDLK